MADGRLDEVDRAIIHALQENARDNTNAEISQRVGVSASTVGKRIARLEERGVIEGYRTEINYEAAGFPLHVLFICTAPVAERESLIGETLGVGGVVSVLELMTGRSNVHIQVVGSSNDDVTRVAQTLDRMGYSIKDEILIRDEYDQPSSHFDV